MGLEHNKIDWTTCYWYRDAFKLDWISNQKMPPSLVRQLAPGELWSALGTPGAEEVEAPGFDWISACISMNLHPYKLIVKHNSYIFKIATGIKQFCYGLWIFSSSSSSLSCSCLADKSFPWASASSELEKALDGIVRLPLLILSSPLAGCYKWAGNPPGCRSVGWRACLACWRYGSPNIFSLWSSNPFLVM